MCSRKKTAVICLTINIFERWCKARRFSKFKNNQYIDSEGEVYVAVYDLNHALGQQFNSIEETLCCHNLEHYDKIKENLLLRLKKEKTTNTVFRCFGELDIITKKQFDDVKAPVVIGVDFGSKDNTVSTVLKKLDGIIYIAQDESK